MLQRILLAGLVGLRFADLRFRGGPILGILVFRRYHRHNHEHGHKHQ